MIKTFNLATAFLVIGIAVLFSLTPQASATHFEHTTTFGAFGTGDGKFKNPSGIAVNDTHIFVVDSNNQRIQIFTLAGAYVNKFGSSGAGNGQFSNPTGIAVNDTHIFVIDRGNKRVQIFTLTGGYVNQFGSEGTGNGEFSNPSGITVNDTHIFVTDRDNDKVQIFNITNYSYVNQFGVSGNHDGAFSSPSGIAVNSENIFVADSTLKRVQIFGIDTYLYQGQFGSLGTGNGEFSSTSGIAVNDTHIFVVDGNNSNVQIFTVGGVYVDRFGSSGNGNGQFNGAQEIAISDASIFTTEGNTNRVQIFAIPSTVFVCPIGQVPNSGDTCVADTEKPVIKVGGVIGNRMLTVSNNKPYTELPATVTDNDSRYTGTVNVATAPGPIIFNAQGRYSEGTYTVTYSAPADAAGNNPIPVVITVNTACEVGEVFNINGICINFSDFLFFSTPPTLRYSIGDSVSIVLSEATGGSFLSDNFIYTAMPLPAGLSFDSNTRRLSGTPEENGTTTVNYRVGDSAVGNTDALSTTVTFNIVIGNTPALAPIDNQIFSIDQQVSITLPVASGGTPPYTYTLIPAIDTMLPAGLTHNTGVTPQTITGVPTTIDSIKHFVYKVVDGADFTDEIRFSIRIVDRIPTSQTFTVNPTTVTESSTPTNLTFTVTLNGGTFHVNRAFRVQLVSGGSATGGIDYAPVLHRDLIIPAEARSVNVVIPFTALSDRVVETISETVIFRSTLRNIVNGAAQDGFATVDTTITINDEGTLSYDFTQNGSVTQSDGLVFYLLASGVSVAATSIVVEREGNSPIRTAPSAALEALKADIDNNDPKYDFTQNSSVTQSDGLVFYLLASGVSVAATSIVVEREGNSPIRTAPSTALEALKAAIEN